MPLDPAQRDRQAFSLGISYLCSFEGVTEEIVKREIEKPPVSFPDDMREVFRQLVNTAQNYWIMPKIIGDKLGGIDKLESVLADFSPHDVVRLYGLDAEVLLDRIEDQLKPKDGIHKRISMWRKFCRSVLDGARFLSQFDSAKDFYAWCNSFDQDSNTRIDLPISISKQVYGIGFALACDFVKELGYLNFGKPDVHIKDIFSALDLCRDEDDLEVFKALQRVAQSTGQTVFAVDRLFWVIGKDHLCKGTRKDAFIEYALDHLED